MEKELGFSVSNWVSAILGNVRKSIIEGFSCLNIGR